MRQNGRWCAGERDGEYYNGDIKKLENKVKKDQVNKINAWDVHNKKTNDDDDDEKRRGIEGGGEDIDIAMTVLTIVVVVMMTGAAVLFPWEVF